MVLTVISLLGGLAMFLYGMRLMGDSLKEGNSGTLKVAMEKVTNNVVKAFLLGMAITAIIQSSTATIVITSGLVAAGVIRLDQSLGIIVGANVGTTITGQITRLLDVEEEASGFLQYLRPTTLAPVALVIGIALIMFFKFKKSDNIGNIAVGFGILFSGLINMTQAVEGLKASGVLDSLFLRLGENPFIAYGVGSGVAFVLQSSSATISILQAFSLSADIPFKALFVVVVGIYLGDCVTTAIVCSIGSKPEAKRVGIVNILFNLSETILVLVVMNILHACGMLDNLWNEPLRAGGIANMNTIFNLGCAILLLPMVKVYAKLSKKIVKDEPEEQDKYADKINALSPVFFATPALAFRGCYEALDVMLHLSCDSINKAFGTLYKYDAKVVAEIEADEKHIDHLTDCVDTYLVKLSPHISEDLHVRILEQYHKMVTEFERLGDHAVNIAEEATKLSEEDFTFTQSALAELTVAQSLLNKIMSYTVMSFEHRDAVAARHIEPLEEVMDDMVNTLHDNHLMRLREGKCTIRAGVIFMEILNNLERISDTCSNVGVAILARVNPETASLAHDYISSLHQGHDTAYNEEYLSAHDEYFGRLEVITPQEKNSITE